MTLTAVATMRVSIRCAGRLKDGRLCDHVIAKVEVGDWETKILAGVEVECRRCGKLSPLSDYEVAKLSRRV